MKLTSALLATAISCCLLACNYDDSQVTRKISNLEQKIDSLTLQLSVSDSFTSDPPSFSDSWEYEFLNQQISGLQTEVSQLQTNVWTLQNTLNGYKTAVFDATAPKGYQPLQSNTGQFLVVLDGTDPYLDGYRLKFEIGNPYSASFRGLEITLKWGMSFNRFSESKSPTQYSKWQRSLRSKQVTLTQDLEPATWNNVNIVVSPAKPDQLSYIEISMVTKSVSLNKK